jgi:hypothetical protein
LIAGVPSQMSPLRWIAEASAFQTPIVPCGQKPNRLKAPLLV